MSLEFLENRFDEVSYLQNLLIAHATGKPADSGEYQQLRHKLLGDSEISSRLPSWLRLHRDLESFWGFIQPKFASYAERRTYLSQQFTPLLDALELGQAMTPSEASNPVMAPLIEPLSPWPQTAPQNKIIERNKRNV